MDIFLSNISPDGQHAGIFEADDETAYFYLYALSTRDGQKVAGAIHIWSGNSDVAAERLAIRWSADGQLVGLFVDSTLWAAFDVASKMSYGGDYKSSASPSIAGGVAGRLK